VRSVAVCDYRAGNTRSVMASLARLGVEVTLTSAPQDVESASLAVLPGVGSARSAMEALRESGLDGALRQRVREGRPVLGICLGLQLALEWSDEDGGVACLGILAGRVKRLTEGRIPRMGWALVEPWHEAYYFAHSYAATSESAVATSDGLVAAARRGSFFGVQFHPEKSGPAGQRFLKQCLTDG
jgi:imidazole glycerol phosphate synthase glutamine amidotransferase subunit